MSFVMNKTIGNNTYIFECESYRDENGNPRNRRVSIGKIDKKTGEPKYKHEYLQKLINNCVPAKINEEELFFLLMISNNLQ